MLRKDYWESKIIVPEVFHELLYRKDIAAIIDNTSLDEVICLVAPYGCGKTLAVVSWLRVHGSNAAWITLDEKDDSEETLFANLSAAIMRLNGWQGSMGNILDDPKFIENPYAYLWKHILIAENSNVDKIMVIDRLQFIRNTSLLRSIKKLLSDMLRHWRIIIIDRAELPSIFNDLMLKKHICLITLKELSFNQEEIEMFFSINGCTVSPEEISQISKETEGWPASLSVILTISRGGPISYSEVAREYVMGFFETEIWEYLDDDIKDFLLRTSILDKLTPAVCNAVTNKGATLPVLRWLFENGLFIYRLAKKDTYQYKRVFIDFLQYKFKTSGIDEKELYKKVGWWMFERDEFEQSFPYFFKAGDLYGLSRVLRHINSASMGMDKYLELTSCITSLNPEKLREYPLIIAKMALIHYALGNIIEMQYLQAIFDELIEPGMIPLTPEEYAECIWESGWLAFLNPDEPILNNKKHDEWYNYIEENPHLKPIHQIRAAVYRFPSILRGIRDYCPVLGIIEEYAQINRKSGTILFNGKFSEARRYIVRAEYAYELEDFYLAEELIRSVMAEVERQQFMDLYFVCISLLAKIMRAVHNPDEIGMLLSRLKSMILKNGYICMMPRFHALELRNRLADGIPGQTRIFEMENKDYADKPYFYLFYRQMTLVRALLSTGNYNEALMILVNQEFLCEQYNRTMDLIEINILKSVANYSLGHEDGARRYFTEALETGREYGFIRIFSDEAKDIWPILEMVNKECNDNYIKKIIISCKKMLTRAGINPNKKSMVYSDLTKTEIKLLKTLNTGMSYKEIALDNNIKVSTVKSHIHSIYSKLDVDNRTSAVLIARQMGITE